MVETTPPQRYAIAIGSNRPGRHGPPKREVAAAVAALGGVIAVSPIVDSAPLGPSTRRFANAAAIIETAEAPPVLLARLKRLERKFGRRHGRRWGARVIDLDIILWSGGCWSDRALTIPHPAFRTRAFVLMPLMRVAATWRDPITVRTIRQLAGALTGGARANRAGASGAGP